MNNLQIPWDRLTAEHDKITCENVRSWIAKSMGLMDCGVVIEEFDPKNRICKFSVNLAMRDSKWLQIKL